MYRQTAVVFLTATALALAACGGPEFTAGGRALPTPDDPGLYVLTAGDELRRIDGSPEWEEETWPSRSDLRPDVEFIIYEPALADAARSGEGAIRLWRVAWLRSELEPTGQAAPVSGSQWVVAGLDGLAVPLAATPHPEERGVIHLRPAEGLSPGLYELRSEPAAGPVHSGRIGIRWSSTDKRAYSAAHCVDRVVGGEKRFRPCTASNGARAEAAGSTGMSSPTSMTTTQSAADALKIELFDPVPENGGLTVRGRVTNRSDAPRSVPMLKGTILDRSGNPTDSWLFTTPESTVPAGGTIAFTTWRPASEGAARINVDFAQN